jgi:hypothetical protein
MANHLSPRPWAIMTVEVCLLRAGTTSAALLDMIVCMFGVMLLSTNGKAVECLQVRETWNDVGGGGSVPRGD